MSVCTVSIIIVNYNTKALCSQTIQTVLETVQNASYEVLVVDNSSEEQERYDAQDPHVIVFSGIENRGFGHACNWGARHAKGKYLLFLNSDTLLDPHALDDSIAYMEAHPDIGALGIRTTLADGRFDAGCKRGFPTPVNSLCYFLGLDRRYPNHPKFGGYHLTYLSIEETHDVDAVSGAFLLVPRDLFLQLDGFDEDFFMYGEDLDLCYRIKEQGKRVVYYAQAHMVHLKGQSGLSDKSPKVIQSFYQAMRLFYDKHYLDRYSCITTGLVHGAIRCKYYLAMRNNKGSNK